MGIKLVEHKTGCNPMKGQKTQSLELFSHARDRLRVCRAEVPGPAQRAVRCRGGAEVVARAEEQLLRQRHAGAEPTKRGGMKQGHVKGLAKIR